LDGEPTVSGPSERNEDVMRIKRLGYLVIAIVVVSSGSARAQAPWPNAGTQQLPPDPTVPYLPAAAPIICPNGEGACLAELETQLQTRTDALGCDHDAVFSDAYLTITQGIHRATATAGFFDRPDRVNHEARTYAQAYFDQYDDWHAGENSAVSPAWRSPRAAQEQSVTAVGALMLALNGTSDAITQSGPSSRPRASCTSPARCPPHPASPTTSASTTCSRVRWTACSRGSHNATTRPSMTAPALGDDAGPRRAVRDHRGPARRVLARRRSGNRTTHAS
jgi:hypothetical protein